MRLIDANLLLYAYDSQAPLHPAARRWWETTLNSPDPVYLAWSTLVAFLRITTHPHVMTTPLTIKQSVDIVDSWLERPTVYPLGAGPGHWSTFKQKLIESQARANLVTDTHLASLAIDNGLILSTHDRDFTRFPRLKVEFPLQ